ncbi:Hypothetical protein R9X50_00555400 [Acrodontium crateriforme]|uniref:Uncharacterized protein n=1 Tax=Acrodontium crateriforme TaxID=150365 RepID=A0AAQ3M7Z5_9PEZI|nr:Hypothetical protein R9X50_00555400 [Acrodontium crateriforme]
MPTTADGTEGDYETETTFCVPAHSMFSHLPGFSANSVQIAGDSTTHDRHPSESNSDAKSSSRDSTLTGSNSLMVPKTSYFDSSIEPLSSRRSHMRSFESSSRGDRRVPRPACTVSLQRLPTPNDEDANQGCSNLEKLSSQFRSIYTYANEHSCMPADCICDNYDTLQAPMPSKGNSIPQHLNRDTPTLFDPRQNSLDLMPHPAWMLEARHFVEDWNFPNAKATHSVCHESKVKAVVEDWNFPDNREAAAESVTEECISILERSLRKVTPKLNESLPIFFCFCAKAPILHGRRTLVHHIISHLRIIRQGGHDARLCLCGQAFHTLQGFTEHLRECLKRRILSMYIPGSARSNWHYGGPEIPEDMSVRGLRLDYGIKARLLSDSHIDDHTLLSPSQPFDHTKACIWRCRPCGMNCGSAWADYVQHAEQCSLNNYQVSKSPNDAHVGKFSSTSFVASNEQSPDLCTVLEQSRKDATYIRLLERRVEMLEKELDANVLSYQVDSTTEETNPSPQHIDSIEDDAVQSLEEVLQPWHPSSKAFIRMSNETNPGFPKASVLEKTFAVPVGILTSVQIPETPANGNVEIRKRFNNKFLTAQEPDNG